MNNRMKGFTLAELLVGLTLGILVIGGATGVFLANQQTSKANMVLSDMQNIARLSFQLMSQDIRNAGFSGCNNNARVANTIAIAGTRPAWATWSVGAGIQGLAAPVGVINGTNTTPATEALRLMFGSGDSNAISNYDGSVFTLNITPVLAAGEVAVACDDSESVIFQANEVDALTVTHQLAGLNADANLGFLPEIDWAPGLAPPRIFSRNGMVMRFESIAWFVAPSNDDSEMNSLYRASLIGDAQINEEVLFGVSDLQFMYRNRDSGAFQTAAATTAAGQWGRINAVNVSVTLDDRIFNGQEVPANAKTIRFLVALRNRL
ncbi:PilW family protein [Rheinheimera maricola]|uniref:Prepilin-type N-terminal cleavage/methylation domain-containing protein n=1 Tax=Rheinheimera maricola TaxID=2793282 RepID=A0ABS7XAE5_9GAMM|nr:prepilin-type N-terminal cleavage/methylation domain-containing protein [Rheinheimera maricola]MBZ9612533.1 prepilin-type N-terminal cleavage/methylation domain-containing protein [Rheinheimera maricola]